MEKSMANIPSKDFNAAIRQWIVIGSFMFVMWLLTYFPMGLLVARFSKPMTNIHGESEADHNPRYIAEGSSGKWVYEGVDVPIVEWWSNLEDGQRGEPSGKWSASCSGKETTFWNKYRWAIRNPFNKFKRESPTLSCFVNDCTVEYWGDRVVTDKSKAGAGAYFVKATHKVTGKVYYGYRKVVILDTVGWYVSLRSLIAKTPWLKQYVNMMDNRLYQATFGYKIKPTHDTEVQDSDDLDKAFTFRIQFWGNLN